MRDVFIVDGSRTPFLKTRGRPGPFTIDTAYRYIREGKSDLILAGGAESLSHAPLVFGQDFTVFMSAMTFANSALDRAKVLASCRPEMLTPVVGLEHGLIDPISELGMARRPRFWRTCSTFPAKGPTPTPWRATTGWPTRKKAGILTVRSNSPSTRREMSTTRGAGIPFAYLIIEAALEKSELKEKIYAATEPRMKEGAVLATNTSSIPLATLAKTLARPQRFVGMHFFNPASRMQLVAVVRHDGLDPEVEALARGFRLDRPAAGACEIRPRLHRQPRANLLTSPRRSS